MKWTFSVAYYLANPFPISQQFYLKNQIYSLIYQVNILHVQYKISNHFNLKPNIYILDLHFILQNNDVSISYDGCESSVEYPCEKSKVHSPKRQVWNKLKYKTKTKGTKAWNPWFSLQKMSGIRNSWRESVHCLPWSTLRGVLYLKISIKPG